MEIILIVKKNNNNKYFFQGEILGNIIAYSPLPLWKFIFKSFTINSNKLIIVLEIYNYPFSK